MALIVAVISLLVALATAPEESANSPVFPTPSEMQVTSRAAAKYTEQLRVLLGRAKDGKINYNDFDRKLDALADAVVLLKQQHRTREEVWAKIGGAYENPLRSLEKARQHWLNAIECETYSGQDALPQPLRKLLARCVDDEKQLRNEAIKMAELQSIVIAVVEQKSATKADVRPDQATQDGKEQKVGK
jgi:hypothetical protein